MFDNIGSRIKKAANNIHWIGVIVSIVLGIILIVVDANLPSYLRGLITIFGLLIMIFGAFLSWLLSCCLYGYGELIHKTSNIEAYLCQTAPGMNSEDMERLQDLKQLRQRGVISQEEYDRAVARIRNQ